MTSDLSLRSSSLLLLDQSDHLEARTGHSLNSALQRTLATSKANWRSLSRWKSLSPLFAGGFLLALLVGRWWAVLIPVLFGVLAWSFWSGDQEVDAVEIGLFFGAVPTVAALIGLLVRVWADSESATVRPHQRLGRWVRLVIGLDPKTAEQPTTLPRKPRSDRDDRQR